MVLTTLQQYDWPVNLRELEHIMERAVLLSPGKAIKAIALDNHRQARISTGNTAIKSWNEFEKEYILSVLKLCKGKVSGPNSAATILELPPTTLKSKMERLGIKKRHYFTGS